MYRIAYDIVLLSFAIDLCHLGGVLLNISQSSSQLVCVLLQLLQEQFLHADQLSKLGH